MVKTISTKQAQEAVQYANNKSDYVVLGVCLAIIAGILGFVLLVGAVGAAMVPAWAFEESMDGYGASVSNAIFLFIILLVGILVVTRMMRQMYLGNALQVEYSDYAWLRTWSNQVAKDFDMPKVEIMVTQDPYMNAFAFGFAKPYTIVLHSGVIRYMRDDQLRAIMVHEMAHVKYRHTQISTYIGALRAIPFAGGLFGWILDFWSRRAELTADRLALHYLRDVELVKRALIRVHVGPDVADSFNGVAQQWQAYVTNNSLQRFTQTFSSHPFLVRRLARLEQEFAIRKDGWHLHNKNVASVRAAALHESDKA